MAAVISRELAEQGKVPERGKHDWIFVLSVWRGGPGVELTDLSLQVLR
mgnify:CR=1 FL=1